MPTWNDQQPTQEHELTQETPVRTFQSLLSWCRGYEYYYADRKAPQLSHPGVQRWKIIALGALKRMIREFDIQFQSEMDDYIGWYWNAYAPKLSQSFVERGGDPFAPSSPVNKSFRNNFARWRKAQQD